jgi:hypothetical protein
MKATVVDAVGATLGRAVRSGATDAINSETADPVEAVHELLPDGVGSVFEPEISLEETESGYQKVADPKLTRVVISRF